MPGGHYFNNLGRLLVALGLDPIHPDPPPIFQKLGEVACDSKTEGAAKRSFAVTEGADCVAIGASGATSYQGHQ